jgi:hypothetical protein
MNAAVGASLLTQRQEMTAVSMLSLGFGLGHHGGLGSAASRLQHRHSPGDQERRSLGPFFLRIFLHE